MTVLDTDTLARPGEKRKKQRKERKKVKKRERLVDRECCKVVPVTGSPSTSSSSLFTSLAHTCINLHNTACQTQTHTHKHDYLLQVGVHYLENNCPLKVLDLSTSTQAPHNKEGAYYMRALLPKRPPVPLKPRQAYSVQHGVNAALAEL